MGKVGFQESIQAWVGVNRLRLPEASVCDKIEDALDCRRKSSAGSDTSVLSAGGSLMAGASASGVASEAEGSSSLRLPRAFSDKVCWSAVCSGSSDVGAVVSLCATLAVSVESRTSPCSCCDFLLFSSLAS